MGVRLGATDTGHVPRATAFGLVALVALASSGTALNLLASPMARAATTCTPFVTQDLTGKSQTYTRSDGQGFTVTFEVREHDLFRVAGVSFSDATFPVVQLAVGDSNTSKLAPVVYPITPPATSDSTFYPGPTNGTFPINTVGFCYAQATSSPPGSPSASASLTPPPTKKPTPPPSVTPPPTKTPTSSVSAPPSHPPTPTATDSPTPAPIATPSPTASASATTSPAPTPVVTGVPTASPTLGGAPPLTPVPTSTITTSGPTESPSASPSPPVVVAVGGLPPDSFAASVPTLGRLSLDPLSIGRSALLALLFLLLAAFPGQLFNKTYEENQEEIHGWFARGGKRFATAWAALSAFWNRRVGIFTFVIISALLYGFLSPSFGLDASSIASLLGILAGLVVVILAFELPIVRTQHRLFRDRGTVRVVPMTIVVALICVVASRLTDFQPGYLYGLVAGYVFASDLELPDEAKAHAATGVCMLVISVAAWLLMPLVDDALADQQLLDIALSAALATIVVAGLEGLLFELLPLRFLRGERVWAWRRSVWVVLFLVAAFLFVYIMVDPNVSYLGTTRVSPLLPAILLFVGFGVISVVFWAYFRFRPEHELPST